jgi:hypothetical protein
MLAVLRNPASAQTGEPAQPWVFGGAITFGVRALAVNGSQEQFDETWNLDPGLVLRELSLDGERPTPGGPPEHLSLRAYSLGDPDSSARADWRRDDWSLDALYTRSDFHGAAQDDLHAYEMERERAGLHWQTGRAGGAEPSLRIGFDWSQAESISFGSRSVDFGFVAGFPVHRDERTLGTSAELGLPLCGFETSSRAGYEHGTQHDSDHFRELSPSDPAFVQTEDYAADAQRDAWLAGTRWRRRGVLPGLDLDFGVDWLDHDGTLDMDLDESGILFSADSPFVRTTAGSGDVHARVLDWDAGLALDLGQGRSARARFRQYEHTEDGAITLDSILVENGGPPSEQVGVTTTHHASRGTLIELGYATPLGETTELDVGGQIGREHLNVEEDFNGGPVKRFDGDLDEAGGAAALAWDASARWRFTLRAALDVTPSKAGEPNFFLVFKDERERALELSGRFKPAPGTSYTARAKIASREIESFGSHYGSAVLSLSGNWSSSPRWSTDAAWSLHVIDYDADTNVLLLDPFPTLFPAHARFLAQENVLDFGTQWNASERFQPRLAAALSLGSGDVEYAFEHASLDLPWQFRPQLLVGLESMLAHLRAEGTLDGYGYTATQLMLYARFSF